MKSYNALSVTSTLMGQEVPLTDRCCGDSGSFAYSRPDIATQVKFRKQQRGRMKGKAWTGGRLSFGDFGLKALECGWVSQREIEAGRIAITRFIKRSGRIWIRMFPDKPITKKPAETRMGKGKGSPEMWVAVIQPGRILFEMEGVEGSLAREAFRLAAHKLSIPTVIVERRGMVHGS